MIAFPILMVALLLVGILVEHLNPNPDFVYGDR